MLRVGIIALFASTAAVSAAPWIIPDWANKEPQFPPGSLFWHTNQYKTCPVVFRTTVTVQQTPVRFAGVRLAARQYAFVFLNGTQIASQAGKEDVPLAPPLDVELTPFLKPGVNVLVVSTKGAGLSLDGCIAYADGKVQRVASDAQWRVQKLAPLTVLELEPFMVPAFDAGTWFGVKESLEQGVTASEQETGDACAKLSAERLARLDAEGAWRLKMLAEKGWAIVDWEAHGWGGAGRLPSWLRELATPQPDAPAGPGDLHRRAESLTRFVALADRATNLRNQVGGLRALGVGEDELAPLRATAAQAAAEVAGMEADLKGRDGPLGLPRDAPAARLYTGVLPGRNLNALNACMDNKFGWFDTTQLLDSSPAGWGLKLTTPGEVFSSPLSPASLVTLTGSEFGLAGWDALEPGKVYEKPALLGPVALWCCTDGKLVALKPDAAGLVYDRAKHGALTENWVLLPEQLNRGGRLPVQLVFLNAPERISFAQSERGVSAVSVTFGKPGARLFILKPLKEWRGFLQQSRILAGDPQERRAQAQAAKYAEVCRFWSRALLHYPVTFSEPYVRDPEDPWALRVADVYNYLDLQDEWGTQAVRYAPLPPLATYGLMKGYPGLEPLSEAQTVGSRGIWGDEVGALNTDQVLYRVPLDPIKRFGGFTAYCFSGADIGVPGSRTEIAQVKSTGVNSFRPQHNQTGAPAMQNLQWAWEQGLQNVFNIDEKWVTDAVEHYRTLATQCRDYPPDAVAYDLLNEPETRDPRAYNALIRKITAAIRAVDKTHLIYVEVIPPWGPGAAPYPKAAFESLEATGDPLTVYSLHDYEYRLPPRWPNETNDVRDILSRWIPAFRFSIDHRAPIHIGEFAAFEQTKESVYTNRCAQTLMLDYLRIFDQFGWHWHYYANRGTVRVREDGSLQESYVQQATRMHLARRPMNVNRAGR